MKKKVSIYVRNSLNCPSSYYRVVQYLNYLDFDFSIKSSMKNEEFRLNMDTDQFYFKLILKPYFYLLMLLRVTYQIIADSINRPDIIFVQRTFLPRFSPILLNLLISNLIKKTYTIWDFDDDILDSKEISYEQYEILKKYSNRIIVSTQYLKNTFDLNERKKVYVIPTIDGDFNTFDYLQAYQKREELLETEFILIWVATSSNFPSLLLILNYLEEAATYLHKKGIKLKLKVVSNKKLETNLQYLNVINVVWSHDILLEHLTYSHVGIMPLIASKFALGKASFKIYQYLTVGLPVIATNYGNNCKVVKKSFGTLIENENLENWKDVVISLALNREKYKKMSLESMKYWHESKFFGNNLIILNSLFNKETI